MKLNRANRSFNRAIATMLVVALSAHGLALTATGTNTAPRQLTPERATKLTLEQALRIICSATGTRGTDGGVPATRPGDSCPLCPAFTGPAVAPAYASVHTPPDWTRLGVAFVRGDVLRSSVHHPHFLARAPPARSFA